MKTKTILFVVLGIVLLFVLYRYYQYKKQCKSVKAGEQCNFSLLQKPYVSAIGGGEVPATGINDRSTNPHNGGGIKNCDLLYSQWQTQIKNLDYAKASGLTNQQIVLQQQITTQSEKDYYDCKNS